MMFKSRVLVLLAVAASVAAAFAGASAAAPGDGVKVTPVASGLLNPRGMDFDFFGNLYVAEGGSGGPLSTKDLVPAPCDQVPGAGPYTGGFTSRISRIDRFGQRKTLVDGLPSSATDASVGSFVSGVADVKFFGFDLYAIEAGAGCSHGLLGTHNSLFRVNPITGRTTEVADLSAFQLDPANAVANPEPGDFEPDGTWYSMVPFAGGIYALEPNHGEVDRISPFTGRISRLSDISATYGHIVPTSISEHAGSLYFGNLGHFPIVPGSSNIYRLDLNGHLRIAATGLSTVLGTAWDRCGRLYALESMTNPGFPAPFFNANSGKVVRINPDRSQTTVVDGLDFPSAIAFAPDGDLYIANDGFGPPSGEILKADLGRLGCGR
jgi:hypothetical protein